jgi:hypothetical protein
MVERAGVPNGIVAWTAAALQAAANREVRRAIPGPAGESDVWDAPWRWWNGRPRVAISYAAAHRASVIGVDASWESERYGSARAQARTHGALSLSRWLTPDVRYTATAGIDTWRGPFTARTAFAAGALERRWQADRLSLSAAANFWIPFGMAATFRSGTLRGAFRSSRAAEAWVYLADIGGSYASEDSPPTVWPRAGEGHAGDVLLRAHPLLNAGVIDFDSRSVFGRTLVYAHGEAQRWIGPALPVRFGLATFVDVARASRRPASAGDSRLQLDLGGGIRLRIPGSEGTLRVDVAHGVRDDADAFTVGWQF